MLQQKSNEKSSKKWFIKNYDKKRKGNNFFPLKGTQLNGHPIIKQKKKRFFSTRDTIWKAPNQGPLGDNWMAIQLFF
jgi:hypothetical protein